MFETTTHDGTPMQVRVSFWQCAKAGAAFAVGYTIVSMLTNAATAFTVLSTFAGFLHLLARR